MDLWQLAHFESEYLVALWPGLAHPADDGPVNHLCLHAADGRALESLDREVHLGLGPLSPRGVLEHEGLVQQRAARKVELPVLLRGSGVPGGDAYRTKLFS